jgi:hypothetical protein
MKAHSLVLSAVFFMSWSPVAYAQQADQPEEPPRQLPASPAQIKVELRVTPADARLSMDGEPLGTGGATLMLAPGAYSVRVEREGYTTLNQEIVLRGDETIPALIIQVHMSRNAPEREVVGRTGGLVEGMGDARAKVGWAGLAVGIGLIATSVYLGLEGGVPDGCSSTTPAACDDPSSNAPAIIAGGFGGALVLGGLGLLVWDSLAGTSPDQRAAVPRVSPALGQGSAGLLLDWRF